MCPKMNISSTQLCNKLMCLEYNCWYICHTVLFTLSWGHITCSAGNALNFRNYISCSLLIHLIKVQWNYLAYVSLFFKGAPWGVWPVKSVSIFAKFLSFRMFLPFSFSPPNRFQIKEGVQDSVTSCQLLQQNIKHFRAKLYGDGLDCRIVDTKKLHNLNPGNKQGCR